MSNRIPETQDPWNIIVAARAQYESVDNFSL
jgi:hypothetical protein